MLSRGKKHIPSNKFNLIYCFFFLLKPQTSIYWFIYFGDISPFGTFIHCTCIRMVKPKQKTDSNRTHNFNNINLNSGIRFFSIDRCWIDLRTYMFVLCFVCGTEDFESVSKWCLEMTINEWNGKHDWLNWRFWLLFRFISWQIQRRL